MDLITFIEIIVALKHLKDLQKIYNFEVVINSDGKDELIDIYVYPVIEVKEIKINLLIENEK